MMAEMESAPVATQEELLALMDARHLCGRGCGLSQAAPGAPRVVAS